MCRVEAVPASDPCVNTSPANAYWGLWWSDGRTGTWSYSSLGVTSLKIPAGGSVAFAWDDVDGSVKPASRRPKVAATPPTPDGDPDGEADAQPDGEADPEREADPDRGADHHHADARSRARARRPTPTPTTSPSATPTAERDAHPDGESVTEPRAVTRHGRAQQRGRPTPRTRACPAGCPVAVVAALFAAAGATVALRRRRA